MQNRTVALQMLITPACAQQMVVENLWTLSGCAPADPTPEELRLDEQRQVITAKLTFPTTTMQCYKVYPTMNHHISTGCLSCLNGTYPLPKISGKEGFLPLLGTLNGCQYLEHLTSGSCALVQAIAAAEKKRKAKDAKQALQAQQEQIAHNPQQAIPAPAGESNL